MMLDWIVERIWAAVNYVPALFVAPESPNFLLIRAMFGLLLLVLVVYMIVMSPLGSLVARCMARVSRVFSRRA
jgi:hypothetical protein